MDILHVNEELRMAAHEINGAVSATVAWVIVPSVDGEIYSSAQKFTFKTVDSCNFFSN